MLFSYHKPVVGLSFTLSASGYSWSMNRVGSSKSIVFFVIPLMFDKISRLRDMLLSFTYSERNNPYLR